MNHDLARSGVQLYTLRDTHDDLLAVVPKLAAMGYEGVELYGGQLAGVAPKALLDVLDEAEMTVSSAHLSLGPRDELDEAELEQLQEVGVDTVIIAYLGPERFASSAAVAAAAEALGAAARQADARGLRLGYHNHSWELDEIDGRPALVQLYEQLAPSVVAEVDVYWAHVGGVDPASLVAELGDRVRFLHVKDGPGVEGRPMVAVGDGLLDIPAILRANPSVEWHLVELDECATDIYDAVAASRRHLSALGLTAERP